MRRFDVSGIGGYIREQRSAAKLSLRQLAAAADVSNPYLSQIERGLRKPSADILYRIAQALRISAETLYIQAGILDADSATKTVPTAVMSDASITAEQRRQLLELYSSFKAQNDPDPGSGDTDRETGQSWDG